MSTLITGGKSALDVHLPGTIGTFRVSSEDGASAGIEVRYLLTHVTLSEKQGQAQLLSMLAPVREVFDLKQLGFDEIMQRDIDDARVSLELIPYLLDSSTSGQIKLFPPIVAVALPLKPNSRAPDTHYRNVQRTRVESAEHKGIKEDRITAGDVGEEQFEFFQYIRNDTALSEGARLSLSRDNCTLAIVDGQHRAMALLALYRNLTGGWTDAKRSPYEGYYQVWPEKEIRSFNLSELQLPVLICTFPQLDKSFDQDVDAVRAARRVFLTLNKTAKKVSDSRNKLLNDQDIVAECLRETLSYVKSLDVKDNTGLRIWNIELDQEGDRVKIASDAAFSGVSHLYHMIEHLLMTPAPVRGIEARGKQGAPRKKLDDAFVRLGLKDDLTSDQKSVNTRVNYSDDLAEIFRKKWKSLYVPIIDTVFGKLHPFAAFSRATINMHQELVGRRDAVLEKMLFDGQATSRTFDDFREGLSRRVSEEPNWSTPEIHETLARVNGLLSSRKSTVENMKANRAAFLLDGMSAPSKRKVIVDGVVVKPVRDAIDRIYENVFSTVAFQTAVVCTYAEAVQHALGTVEDAPPEILEEYLQALNGLLKPENDRGLKAFVQTFEATLDLDAEPKLIPGGPTFRNVVLPGELQPAEWPKYRYMLLELWAPSNPAIATVIDEDRLKGRAAVAKALYKRRLAQYAEDNRIVEDDIPKEMHTEIKARSKELLGEFLSNVTRRRVAVDLDLFEKQVADSADSVPEDLFGTEK